MKFCLEIWGTDYDRIKETCLLAERLGYYGFYYGEALADIDVDCWTVISALAAQTDKIRLGPVITYLLPRYRSIALIAKQAATLQKISNGRLDFRTGAGATLQYAAQWWHPYGIDYPKNPERVDILEEGLHVLKMLWTKDSVQYKGRYFNLNGASIQKPETRIPLTVAAKKTRMMRIAARYADVWEASYLSPERFRKLDLRFADILRDEEGAGSGGNNNNSSRHTTRSIELDVIIADSESELQYRERQLSMERGPNILHQILSNGLVGNLEKVAQRIKEYEKAGVDQFFLAFQDPFDQNALRLFSELLK